MQACCLVWVPLFCVKDLLLVCCQDASGYQPPLLTKRLFFMLFPSSSFSRRNTRGCSERQKDNAGTWEKKISVVAPEVIFTWIGFSAPKHQLLFPCFLNSCLIVTVSFLTVMTLIVPAWFYNTATRSCERNNFCQSWFWKIWSILPSQGTS